MHSKISVHIIGHVSADPRAFDLPRSGGVGCELRLTVARPDFDANGGRVTRNRYLKAVTYDTRLAAIIHRDYNIGDFVEILADDIRAEKPWYSERQRTWLSGGVTVTLTKIRKVTALTPEDDAAPDPEVLDGVTVTSRSEAAEPGAGVPDELAARRRVSRSRGRREAVPDAADSDREAAEPVPAA